MFIRTSSGRKPRMLSCSRSEAQRATGIGYAGPTIEKAEAISVQVPLGP